jgi:hypothetical protein
MVFAPVEREVREIYHYRWRVCRVT